MKHADVVLTDEEIVAAVYEALAKRHPKSRCRGRRGAPADMELRLLILKHIRNWSYEVLEREVRAWCTGTSPMSAAPRCRMPRQ
jgi:IS5 family transposase